MKTETLIELQRSITQGEWACNFGNGTNLTNDVTIWGGPAVIGEVASDLSFPMVDAKSEMPANATAIALVPELLSEVIRLREALSESAALNENFVSVSEPETLCHLSEYRAVIKQARAALVNDK